MTDIKRALRHAIDRLKPSSTSADIDAEILLAFTLATSRAFLYTHSEQMLSHKESETYEQFIAQRIAGMPIAYLTGTREFWSLPLTVGKDTLIPRPETELLVELTLELLKTNSLASVLDLGTGSGAIALALASERPDWTLIAGDSSQAAIAIATHNTHQLGLKNVQLVCSDWFSSIQTQCFHAIVSNPPYIAENDPHLKEGDVRFEPQQALISGADGMDSLRYIIEHAYDHLLPGGLLLLEHGYSQARVVTDLLRQKGYEQSTSWLDHQGHERVSGGWRH